MRLLPSQRPQVQHPHPCPGQPRGWGLSAAGAGAAALPAAPTACPACPACPTCAQRRRSRPPVPRAPRRPRPRRSTALGGHCGRRARRRTRLPSPSAAPPPPRPPGDRGGPPRRWGRACWDAQDSRPRLRDQQAVAFGVRMVWVIPVEPAKSQKPRPRLPALHAGPVRQTYLGRCRRGPSDKDQVMVSDSGGQVNE